MKTQLTPEQAATVGKLALWLFDNGVIVTNISRGTYGGAVFIRVQHPKFTSIPIIAYMVLPEGLHVLGEFFTEPEESVR